MNTNTRQRMEAGTSGPRVNGKLETEHGRWRWCFDGCFIWCVNDLREKHGFRCASCQNRRSAGLTPYRISLFSHISEQDWLELCNPV